MPLSSRHVVVPGSRDGGPIGRTRVTLLLLLFATQASPLTAASSPPDSNWRTRTNASDAFFQNGAIPELRIEIAGTNMARLRRNPRENVRATVREGNAVYEDVAIHVKGAAGSSRPIDANPALTLNFDKFKDGQKFHGLDKLHLNNSVQDGSRMTEAICSELFLDAGVPTARTTHARVWLNGRDLGLYVLKEGYDRAFLKRHFKNAKGNLYDGGFLREITEPLDRDAGSGDVTNYADLRAVASAARDKDPVRRLQRLETVLDVDRFLSFVAIEILTWHWDGYVMKRNNYRVYHDPDSGKCVFIPHGMDQMFWDPNGPILPSNLEGMVARAVLETDEGQRRYRERLASIATNYFTLERMTNQLHRLNARIRPALAAIHPEAAREHDDAFRNLRSQVIARVQRVHTLLNEPKPEPLRFDAAGVAQVRQWSKLDTKSTGLLEQRMVDGRKTLHIAAGPQGNCTASWRSRVLLKGGAYILEAEVRTAGVEPLATDTNRKGKGAGIRISQPQAARTNGLVGDNAWQKVEYTFNVPGEVGDVALVCELRAAKGEVWFDLGSLKVRQRPPIAALDP